MALKVKGWTLTPNASFTLGKCRIGRRAVEETKDEEQNSRGHAARRYRLEAGFAQKRRLYAQLTWWFGGFYSGQLDQVQWTGVWNPAALVTGEFSCEHNVGRLATGRFAQTLTGTRLRLNLSPDLSIASTSSTTPTAGSWARTAGCGGRSVPRRISSSCTTTTSARRWTAGRLDSNQLVAKLQYAFRMSGTQ